MEKKLYQNNRSSTEKEDRAYARKYTKVIQDGERNARPNPHVRTDCKKGRKHWEKMYLCSILLTLAFGRIRGINLWKI